MSVYDSIGLVVPFRLAVTLGLGVALAAALIVTRRAIHKLLGAGITGQDIHKVDRPKVAEMGGLSVFLAFNVGVFVTLGLANLDPELESLLLICLLVAAGACITGVLDDLIELRQRFKAMIPFAFALPLAFFVSDSTILFPLLGRVDFGIWYLVLVPIGVACASNAFNMLEGFNGLGAGLGIIMAASLSLMAIYAGFSGSLVLLFPLMGALAGFLWFNFFPARVFPGDTMTLTVGALLATCAIVSKLEFFGLLLFLPQIAEFLIKAANGFPTRRWGGDPRDGKLFSVRERPVGLGQWIMHLAKGATEVRIVLSLYLLQAIVCSLAGALLLLTF